tara:strand:- start:2647 stop:2856 length:210 start_codon:yes stop_codon:yes gene_type:complete
VLNDVDFRICINTLYDLLLKLNFRTRTIKDQDVQIIMRQVFEIMQDINEHYYQSDRDSVKVANEEKDIH